MNINDIRKWFASFDDWELDIVDWPAVANAIREGRFQEIPQEVLMLLAEKIDPLKGPGRPKYSEKKRNLRELKIAMTKTLKFGDNNDIEMTMVECIFWVEKRFNELVAQGMKKSRATTQIASELNRDEKRVANYLRRAKKAGQPGCHVWSDYGDFGSS